MVRKKEYKICFFNWYLNFTKPYKFRVFNGTVPITTAQPSLNMDTLLSTGNNQNQNLINEEYTHCFACISTVDTTSKEPLLTSVLTHTFNET
jgi:hypothetical protein